MTITTITGTITTPVYLETGNYGLTLTVTNTAEINAPTFAIDQPTATGNAYILNQGSLYGSRVGVELFNGTVANPGYIAGAAAGVALGDTASLINNGTIVSNGTSFPHFRATEGVFLGGSAYLDNLSLVESETDGIDVAGSLSSVVNSGTISGAQDGVFLAGGLVTNLGSISGNSIGSFIRYGTLVNDGVISSSSLGLLEWAGTVIDSGTITSDTTGIVIGGGAFKNQGEIYGSISGAVFGGGTLSNYGTIAGNTYGITMGPQLIFGAPFYNLLNYGTISGVSAAVIGDQFSFSLEPGAKFDGIVESRTDQGVMDVNGTSTTALTGFGTSFIGISTIDFSAGSSWTLEGNFNNTTIESTFPIWPAHPAT
jgi:hypothetical protein